MKDQEIRWMNSLWNEADLDGNQNKNDGIGKERGMGQDEDQVMGRSGKAREELIVTHKIR